MEYVDFKQLCDMLTPHLKDLIGTDNSQDWGPNGRISMNVRVACTIRYFSVGGGLDLINVYGVSKAYMYRSISLVIDAINRCQQLKIKHNEQQKIAQGFQKKSRAKIPCCAGAVDGLLIQINKPSMEESKKNKSWSVEVLLRMKKQVRIKLTSCMRSSWSFY
jgi:hypothetical protein